MSHQHHVARGHAWTDWSAPTANGLFRYLWPSSCCVLACGVLFSAGCANFHEKRTITAFQQQLEEGNVVALKEKSTDRFTAHALRHPESNESLAQLKIPEGKFEILDVEDVSKTEKKVTIGFGEDYKRKILYRLVKDESTKAWKVDDIYLRQRNGEKTLAMAVTEQMDVLLSSREVYEAWSSGDRTRVLKKSGPELSEQLEQLPPSVLAQMVSRTMGAADRNRTFRPEAMISGNEAVVRVNRSHGTIVMTLDKAESSWQLKDIALETREKELAIASLTQNAEIANRALHFLNAWQQNDKEALKPLTQPQFFDAGLAPADLRQMPLPASYDLVGNVEVKLLETYADVVVNDADRTVRLTLNHNDAGEGHYEVANVTIYDLEKKQTLSLSSALTAVPVADLFMESLRQRDQKMLQYSSTMDLHKKTWSRVSQETFDIIPLPFESQQEWTRTDTRFDGPVTQVVMQSEKQELTIVMQDQGGKVLVDDVLISPRTQSVSTDQKQTPQTSLKHYLAAVGPVYEMASSIHHNQPANTLRLVTDDFYDRVFSLSSTMPDSAYTFLKHISPTSPTIRNVTIENGKSGTSSSMQASLIQPDQPVVERYVAEGNETIVEFDSPTGMMQVSLREEQGLLRIDDALVLTPDHQVVMRLKQSMRMDLAASRTKNMIKTVSGEIRTLPADKGTPPLQQPGQLTTAMQDSANPETAGKAELPETLLQNAYYEEYENSPSGQLQHTAGLQPQEPTSKQPTDVNPSEPPSIRRPQEPQRHNASVPVEHLLLKPIPLE